jgi:hypothetical protein
MQIFWEIFNVLTVCKQQGPMSSRALENRDIAVTRVSAHEAWARSVEVNLKQKNTIYGALRLFWQISWENRSQKCTEVCRVVLNRM